MRILETDKSKRCFRFLTLCAVFLWVVFVHVEPAQAQYLDPGSGSYLLQIVIAALLASLFLGNSIVAYSRAVLARILRKVLGSDHPDST